VLGLADDALVLSWLATRLVEETEAFLDWEQAGMPPTAPRAGRGSGATGPGTPGSSSGPSTAPPASGGSTPAASQTVPGDVIR